MRLNQNHRSAHDVGRTLMPPLILLAALMFPPPSHGADFQVPQDPGVAYQEAKDLTLKGEWAEALQRFRALAEGESEQAAGAAFYVGLCLENMQGRDAEAYEAYASLRNRFPDAPMAQEALRRQITLAGALGFSDLRFREFLTEQMKSDDPTVRMEAALSLGRLGDERAVDGLVEIAREGSYDQQTLVLKQVTNFDESVASRLLRDIGRATSEPALKQEAADLGASLDNQRDERARMERRLARDVRALMEAIKRQGDAWTDEELLLHGLYAVMPRKEFAVYVQASAAERSRIYREFWEGIEDPYSETPENEMEIEFQRRIDHARTLFSEPWKGTRSQYDAKEWLTVDTPYAPWDARGMLLIRYGEPTDIFLVGPNVEEWLYPRLDRGIDFTVHKYKLNFLRNAVYPGRKSMQDFPDGYVQARFISTARIEYWPGGRY
jgi:GWxTD domain-containing protein